MSDGARIKAARKAAGMSQVELGAAMGVTQSVVSDWENGKLLSWQENADKLATVLQQPKGVFSQASSSPVHTRGIEVVGEVQGGSFQRALEWPEEKRFSVPVAPLPGYEGIQLRALRVRGNSVNELYPDGSFVIVASAVDVEVVPGDKVVVYSSQGELREATIKEVRVEHGGRVALLPRSSDPEHQSPIYLDPSDQDPPEIAYVVVGSFRQERRPTQAIQFPKRKAQT